jgi:[ribosomal protein S5]-alanine N-acetyltransferase
MEYFLTSSRLGFRCWSADDEPLAMELWGDARVTGLFGGPYTEAMVRTRLKKEMRWAEEKGVQYWPVFLRATGEHAGCAGLQPWPGKEDRMELGYHLRPAFWGKGLATEAGQAVIGYGFERLGLGAIFAGHPAGHTASQKVLLKLGFRFAGEEVYPPSGVLEPSYVIAKEDWERRAD